MSLSRSRCVAALLVLFFSPACVDWKSQSLIPENVSQTGLSLSDIAGLAQQIQITDNEAFISFDITTFTNSEWNSVVLCETAFFLPEPISLSVDYSIAVKNYEDEVVMGGQSITESAANPQDIQALLENSCVGSFDSENWGVAALGSTTNLSCNSFDLVNQLYRNLDSEINMVLFPQSLIVFAYGEENVSKLRLENGTLIDLKVEFCLYKQEGLPHPTGQMIQKLFSSEDSLPYASLQYNFHANGLVDFTLYDAQGNLVGNPGQINLETGLISF